MFRKFQDRVVAAASSAMGMTATSSDATNTVQRLQALGDYTVTEVESALHAAGGNVDHAAEILLLSQPQRSTMPMPTTSALNNGHAAAMDEDMELQQALQQSLDVYEHQPSRSEIMNQAAEAALRRAEASKGAPSKKHGTANTKKKPTTTKKQTTIEPSPVAVPARPVRTKSETLRHHHPDVKLIPKLQDKSTEEQILRTADRMKNHPGAVDTLYRAVSMIHHHPDHDKYRRIDTSTPGYQRSVAPAPGAADFLRAMKFHAEHFRRDSPILVLSDPMYDPALIYLGLSALEQIKLTPEYGMAKKQLVFMKEVTELIDAKSTVTPEELQQRNYYLSQCPQEPSEGRGALLQIHITDTYTIRRRFDSDDTLTDVLHWIAGTVGTTIYHRILQQVYCLMDVNHTLPRTAMDVNGAARHYTLQYIGCWPSGRLQLGLPAPEFGLESSSSSLPTPHFPRTGTSRGLASGASSSDDE